MRNLWVVLKDLGCGPLHAWQVRVLFGMGEKHELIVFSHMHECIHTYNKQSHMLPFQIPNAMLAMFHTPEHMRLL